MVDLNLSSQDEQKESIDLNVIPAQISEEDGTKIGEQIQEITDGNDKGFSNEENMEDIKIHSDDHSDDNNIIIVRDDDKQEEDIIIKTQL